MTLTTKPVLRMFSLFLLLFILFNTLSLPVSAADTVYEDEIELSGKFNGTFTLDSSDMALFNLKDIVPGDTWKGKLHVSNAAYDKMEFSILSIVSNLEDNTLYDALDLRISLGSEVIYNGSYGATQEPISDYYVIPERGKITFDLVVSLPKTAGNDIQNKKMDSTWTFDARYYGQHGGGGKTKVNYTVYYVDEDGENLLQPKTGKGYAMSTVTETAPDIDGYKADASKKTIVLRVGKENKIVFVYSLNETKPVDPSNPSDPSGPDTPGPGGSDTPGQTDPSNPSGGDNPVDPSKPSEGTDPSDPSGPSGEGNPSDGQGSPDEPGTPDTGTEDKPSKVPSVQTGEDLTGSNSMVTTWLFVFVLCLIGGAVLYLRIRKEKMRVLNAQSNRKEVSTNAKK